MKSFISVLILVIVCISNICYTQNLVPNPSFEENWGCPQVGGDFIKVKDWANPVYSTPDYYNNCNYGQYGVPLNISGYQLAKSSIAYTGFVLFESFIGNYREYIQVLLNESLETDKVYKVNFYLSLANKSKYSIKSVGLFFSNSAFDSTNTGYSLLNLTPHLIYDKNFISDTLDWVQIEWSYKALGGEKCITIGNFFPDSLTDFIQVSGTTPYAYYYIDDVAVELDTTVGVREVVKFESEEFKIYPNPSNGTINIINNNNEKPINIEIYNNLGQKVYENSFKNYAIAKNIELNLPNGIYYSILYNENGILYNQKIVIQNK